MNIKVSSIYQNWWNSLCLRGLLAFKSTLMVSASKNKRWLSPWYHWGSILAKKLVAICSSFRHCHVTIVSMLEDLREILARAPAAQNSNDNFDRILI